MTADGTTNAATAGPVAHILGSFAYFAKADLPHLVRRARALYGVEVDFFADSGAFTAYASGKTIAVRQYAAWLAVHAHVINCAATLDVIGDPAVTARNTAALQDAVGDQVYVIPIFHVGSPWTELENLCATHPYVGLGGGVAAAGKQQAAFMAWLVKCHRIGREHGTVFHGFGMTEPPYPEKLPFYSVDSSYWSSGNRAGTIALFDPRTRRFVRARFGTRHAFTRPGMAALIRSYGGDPHAVAATGFGLTAQRGALGRAEHRWVDETSCLSWMRYGAYLRTWRSPIPAPPQVNGTGPKAYLAVVNDMQFDMVVGAALRCHQEEVPV